jgi:hypothetical protein
VTQPAPPLKQTVRNLHITGHSQRPIAVDLGIDRHKVEQIIDGDAAAYQRSKVKCFK